jgi:predicted acylesterase/phospholipase RssA
MLLSGGAFLGAFQVPIIERLLSRHSYAAIRGVSIGALNGVFAACNELDALADLWTRIDVANPVLTGVPELLAPAFLRGKGVLSLEPARRQLLKHVNPEKLIAPFAAGVVIRRTGAFHLLRFAQGKGHPDLLARACVGSGAVAGLFEPVLYPWRLKSGRRTGVLLADGGHVHNIPPPPKGMGKGDVLDVVLCRPLKRSAAAQEGGTGLAENFAWSLDMQAKATQTGDISRLRQLARATGVTVNIWAPPAEQGSALDATAATLQARILAGHAAVEAGPVRL